MEAQRKKLVLWFFKLGIKVNQDVGSEFAIWTSEDGSNNLAVQSTSQKVVTRRK